MKYRIENGQITMPVEELNRLNDQGEELSQEWYELKKREKDIDDKIESRLVLTREDYVKKHHPFGGADWGCKEEWMPIDDAMKGLTDSILILTDKLKKSRDQVDDIKSMSILQFIQWRKK